MIETKNKNKKVRVGYYITNEALRKIWELGEDKFSAHINVLRSILSTSGASCRMFRLSDLGFMAKLRPRTKKAVDNLVRVGIAASFQTGRKPKRYCLNPKIFKHAVYSDETLDSFFQFVGLDNKNGVI